MSCLQVINFKNGSVKHLGLSHLYGVSLSTYVGDHLEVKEFLKEHLDLIYAPRVQNTVGDTVDHALRSLYFYTSDRNVLMQFKMLYPDLILYIEALDIKEDRWQVLYDRFP